MPMTFAEVETEKADQQESNADPKVFFIPPSFILPEVKIPE